MKGTMIESPVGPIVLVSTGWHLTGLYFGAGEWLAEHGVPEGVDDVLEQAKEELEQYFQGSRRVFDTPVRCHGTPFQQKVWETLLTVPYGETRSYKWLAEQVGSPGGFRAVGSANGKNPVSIIVPCHRIINEGGSLGGYGGGLENKRRLLGLEAGSRSLF